MTIKREKIQFDINREAAKISALSYGKIDKYEYLTGEEILPSDQSRIIEQAKFTYSPLDKAFEKQIKTIQDQEEKQIKKLEAYWKQLVKYSDEKESDFNNLIYCYKGESASKNFVGFKGSLVFYKNIKEDHITLEKSEKKQKGGKKSKDQKSAINNIKTLCKSREKVIKLFDDYSRIVSAAKYKTKYGGLKILTPKQMLQRSPMALVPVKTGNTSENLLNEIKQITYPSYQAK